MRHVDIKKNVTFKIAEVIMQIHFIHRTILQICGYSVETSLEESSQAATMNFGLLW